MRAMTAEYVETLNDLHARLAKEVETIFGVSFKLYREFAPARDEWEWTLFSKFIGRRCRFDMSIPADDVGEKYALEKLIAELAYQMQDTIERYSTDVNPGIVI